MLVLGADLIEKLDVKAAGGRLWFGFPHWIVLGWAILISYNVWQLMNWRVNHMLEGDQHIKALNSLVQTVKRLEADSVRTRTILELKFPKTAEKVENVLDENY